MTDIVLDGNQTLVVAIIAYFMGRYLTRRIGFLDRFRIPEAVTGGLVVAVATLLLRQWGNVTIQFTAGDLAMLIFFTTIGLSARLIDLKQGGATLILTLAVCIVAVIGENVIAMLYAALFGAPPAIGIMAGSVALVGGHGTAAAWAPYFEGGNPMAGTIGIASATFGLVAGGLAGGPLGRFLIVRRNLEPSSHGHVGSTLSDQEENEGHIDVPQFFASLLVIAFAIGFGGEIHTLLNHFGVKLPQFVTALFAGILIGNVGPTVFRRVKWPTRSPAMRLISELALSIFLVRVLMSLELWTLAAVAGPLLIVLITQVLFVLVLAYFVLFRLLGRRYDGAVICAGFVGLSLGATPTAVANMDSLSHRFGPSPTAFLVIPLVGAFFIDIVNAFFISVLYRLFH